MGHTNKDIEARLRAGVTATLDDVERRACPCVDVPWFYGSEVIGELDVERCDGRVVAQPDLDVRSKAKPIGEW